jgi:integrase
MVRTIGWLKALTVERARKPGLYPDGGGLWLQIKGKGARSWVFRFKVQGIAGGKARAMGLGSFHDFGLAEARARAAECRRLIAEGIDPIAKREAERAQRRLDTATAKTFRWCAVELVKDKRAGWRNARHASQWSNTLEAYAYPELGDVPVAAVDVAAVLRVLRPIWNAKPETASRLRGRVEAVLSWAAVHGYRHGNNPAQWRGRLDAILPSKGKLKTVKHHPALPYSKIGAFVTELRALDSVAARALEFAILTAARVSEVTGATWAEVDLAAALWTVPADRIKAGREHRVPLSAAALVILRGVEREQRGAFIFQGNRPGKALSVSALPFVLKRMGREDLTVHGFRSTFRDWAAEQTNFPSEAAEMALAHAVGSRVEAAYRRGDMIERRRQLMEAWARYCGTVSKGGKVVSIRGAEA